MNRALLLQYARDSRTANSLLTAIEYLESAAHEIPNNLEHGFDAMDAEDLKRMRACLMAAEQRIADVKAAIRVLRVGGL